jgi:hypothetical protein
MDYMAARRLATIFLVTQHALRAADIVKVTPKNWSFGQATGRLQLPDGTIVEVPCSQDHLACPRCAFQVLATQAGPDWQLFDGGLPRRGTLSRSSDPRAGVSDDIRRLRGCWDGVRIEQGRVRVDTRNVDVRLLMWQSAGLVSYLQDRALLLVAFHLGLRAIDATRLQRADFCRVDDAYLLTVRGSRHRVDDVRPFALRATADPLLDPVAALDLWLVLRDGALGAPGTATSPLFCYIGPGQRLEVEQPLEYYQITDRLRHLQDAAGLPRTLSGHSMRVGFAELSLQQGIKLDDLQYILRVVRARTAARYATPQTRGGSASTRLRAPEPG